jgi:hypothetical protein
MLANVGGGGGGRHLMNDIVIFGGLRRFFQRVRKKAVGAQTEELYKVLPIMQIVHFLGPFLKLSGILWNFTLPTLSIGWQLI